MLKLQIIGPYLYSLKLRGITGENSIHLQIIIPVFQRRSRSNVWEFYLICRVEKVNYSTNMRDNVETVIYCRLIDDLEISVIEGVSSGDISSISRNPTLTGSETQDHQPGTMFSETEDQLRNVRRVWSREEFLHETAVVGGPDVSRRPRLVKAHQHTFSIEFCPSHFSPSINRGQVVYDNLCITSTYLCFMLLN